MNIHDCDHLLCLDFHQKANGVELTVRWRGFLIGTLSRLDIDNLHDTVPPTHVFLKIKMERRTTPDDGVLMAQCLREMLRHGLAIEEVGCWEGTAWQGH